MARFNDILKELRTTAHLTQDELSKKLKISRSAIGMYEGGSREPDFKTLELIADYFNVDIDYLIGRADRPSTSSADDTLTASADPSLKALMDAARNLSHDDIQILIDMAVRLQKKEPDA